MEQKFKFYLPPLSYISSINKFSVRNYYTSIKLQALKGENNKINNNFLNIATSSKDLFLTKLDGQEINYLDKYEDFSEYGKSIIRNKYKKIAGVYLWLNKENNRSYVGRSVNIYRRLSQYLSSTYISNNNKKMAICGSILKYGYTNFTFYVLEICKNNISRKDFSERENYWFEKLKPSYNIQDILHPFSGSNHYRFGKNLDLNTKPLF